MAGVWCDLDLVWWAVAVAGVRSAGGGLVGWMWWWLCGEAVAVAVAVWW